MGHGSSRLPKLIGLALFGILACGGGPARAQTKPATAAVSTTLPDDRLGTRVAPLLLLTRADVCADLELRDDLKAGAFTTIGEIERRASVLKGREGPSVIVARKEIDDTQWRWLETNLTEHQQVRLAQIELQWEGPSAIVRPVIARSLELTTEQRVVIGTAAKKVKDARDHRKLTLRDELELNRTALETLTPAQRERWENMRGPQFRPRLATANAGEKTKDKDTKPASK